MVAFFRLGLISSLFIFAAHAAPPEPGKKSVVDRVNPDDVPVIAVGGSIYRTMDGGARILLYLKDGIPWLAIEEDTFTGTRPLMNAPARLTWSRWRRRLYVEANQDWRKFSIWIDPGRAKPPVIDAILPNGSPEKIRVRVVDPAALPVRPSLFSRACAVFLKD